MFPRSLAALCLALLVPTLALSQPKVTESYGSGPKTFLLATGSPGELGLLKLLGEAFAAKNGATLQWVKAGTGESLDLLKAKQVDMVMVHAPAKVDQAVKEGWAVKKTLIGSNEFFIVGPAADPAGIARLASAVEAYKAVAAKQAKFFSRGDNSGTHQKETAVWKAAGVEPSGPWYIVTKDFMTATLKRANDEGGYFMTDSSTWVAEGKNMPKLAILFKGDKMLVNTYHALAQPKGATPGAETAAAFIDFVASKEGQDIIRSYGKAQYGESLYNDADYAKKYD
ncbi:Tungstate-binding protein TupA [Fundidesulfovibrio magnetotacticus]|uniref:Tungstate-binding protein TupA n=1 Tax=Fundidesulfovibrio magnetotacticus TaxID=2730080 RepID=A0A6V8LPG4_9BACT|nr:substrate-binding domain-containing protein [Fundidesulfovibrio magnetotacticus]GFK92890.1 Tungstate-binding protein TupA [Fundidesulfovibrio magnetotacticus]